MLRLYDFECPDGHRKEYLISDDARQRACEVCGKTASRLIPAPRAVLDGCSGDFPTAADQWEKRRQSHMKKEQKHFDSHGTYWLDK